MSVYDRLGVKKKCITFRCNNRVASGGRYCEECTEEYKVRNGVKTILESGEVDVYKEFYNSSAWKKMRRRIKERDDYQCQICLRNGREGEVGVDVHHRVKLRNNYSLRLEPDNLITLCKDCHYKEDRNNRRRRL